jgi:predicted O-methyltransferase YrrM
VRVLKHFLRWQFGLARAETATTEDERVCLTAHAAGKRCLVEVGVWHGVTTRTLRAVMAPHGILYAVDPYPAGRLGFSVQRWIARSEVSRVANGQVEWVRASGTEAAKRLAEEVAGKIDFIFIDGDHSYDGIKGDWEAWSGLVAPGGLIGLHDSRATPARPIDDAGSARYTREVILHHPGFKVVNQVDSLTVVQRLTFGETGT